MKHNFKDDFEEVIRRYKLGLNHRDIYSGSYRYLSELSKLVKACGEGLAKIPDKFPSRNWLHENGYVSYRKSKCGLDYNDWSSRARSIINLIKSGASSTDIMKSDPALYKGWITTLRGIACGDEFPSAIPPRDYNDKTQRKSKICYTEWKIRIFKLSDAYKSGVRGVNLRRLDSVIYDSYLSIVYDVVSNPDNFPNEKLKSIWAMDRKFLTYNQWRNKIFYYVNKLKSGTLKSEFYNTSGSLFYSKYRKVIDKVLNGESIPSFIDDDLAKGSMNE